MTKYECMCGGHYTILSIHAFIPSLMVCRKVISFPLILQQTFERSNVPFLNIVFWLPRQYIWLSVMVRSQHGRFNLIIL